MGSCLHVCVRVGVCVCVFVSLFLVDKFCTGLVPCGFCACGACVCVRVCFVCMCVRVW